MYMHSVFAKVIISGIINEADICICIIKENSQLRKSKMCFFQFLVTDYPYISL